MPVRDTIYSAAASFEDLPLSKELLQVQVAHCQQCAGRVCWCTTNGGRELQGLYTEMKFEKPSRIQALTLPMILKAPYRSLIAQVLSVMWQWYAQQPRKSKQRDAALSWGICFLPSRVLLCVQAHNGSGKTTCFVLAMLSRVDPELAQPQALCVCPTRYAAPTQFSTCWAGLA